MIAPTTARLEDAVAELVAAGSGVDYNSVLSGNKGTLVPDGLFASLVLIHQAIEGIPATVMSLASDEADLNALDAVEVEHDGSQFVLTLPLGLDGFATEVSGPFTGEHADELGLGTVEITAGVDGIGAGSLTWHGSSISVDFTGADSYDDVASTLQTALRAVTASGRADLRSASVEYDPADFFRASLGFRTNGDPYPINGFKVDVAQGAASALGLDNASGGSIDPGHASETIGEAMDVISGLELTRFGGHMENWYH